MASDEAVIRIVLEDASSSTQSATAGAPPSAGTPPPPSSPSPASEGTHNPAATRDTISATLSADAFNRTNSLLGEILTEIKNTYKKIVIISKHYDTSIVGGVASNLAAPIKVIATGLKDALAIGLGTALGTTVTAAMTGVALTLNKAAQNIGDALLKSPKRETGYEDSYSDDYNISVLVKAIEDTTAAVDKVHKRLETNAKQEDYERPFWEKLFAKFSAETYEKDYLGLPDRRDTRELMPPELSTGAADRGRREALPSTSLEELGNTLKSIFEVIFSPVTGMIEEGRELERKRVEMEYIDRLKAVEQIMGNLEQASEAREAPNAKDAAAAIEAYEKLLAYSRSLVDLVGRSDIPNYPGSGQRINTEDAGWLGPRDQDYIMSPQEIANMRNVGLWDDNYTESEEERKAREEANKLVPHDTKYKDEYTGTTEVAHGTASPRALQDLAYEEDLHRRRSALPEPFSDLKDKPEPTPISSELEGPLPLEKPPEPTVDQFESLRKIFTPKEPEPTTDPAFALVEAAGDLQKAASDLSSAAEDIKRPRGHGPDRPDDDSPPPTGPSRPPTEPPGPPFVPAPEPTPSPTPSDSGTRRRTRPIRQTRAAAEQGRSQRREEVVGPYPSEEPVPVISPDEPRGLIVASPKGFIPEQIPIDEPTGQKREEGLSDSEKIIEGGTGAKPEIPAKVVGPTEDLGEDLGEEVITGGGSSHGRRPKRESGQGLTLEEAEEWRRQRLEQLAGHQPEEPKQEESLEDIAAEAERRRVLDRPKVEAPKPQPKPPPTAEPPRAAAKLLGLKPDPTPEQELAEERARALKHREYTESQSEPEEPSVEELWKAWDRGKRPKHGKGWNTLNAEQWQAVSDLGALDPGPRKSATTRISQDEYDRFVSLLRERGDPPPKFKQGGEVPDKPSIPQGHPGESKGTDTVPAWLSPDEFVVNAEDAQANKEELEEINSGQRRNDHMSEGGFVNYLAKGGKPKDSKKGSLVGRMVSGTAEAAGTAVSGAVSWGTSGPSDASDSVKKFGDTLSKVGSQIPYLGVAATLAGESLKGLSSVMDSISKTADKYGEYSPEIAQAQAVAEIKQTMGDLRRSGEASKELSQFIMSQSDLQQKFEDIKINLLKKITPVATKILQVVEAGLELYERALANITEVSKPVTDKLEEWRKEINAFWQEEKRYKDTPLDPTEILLNSRRIQTPGTGSTDKPGLAPEE